MRGKIDEHGILWIERRGEQRIQFCCNKENVHCGQWCPLFGEPEYCAIDDRHTIQLNICQNKKLIFTSL